MKKISNLPRVLGPADSAVCERHDCTTLQLCDDSQVISKWVTVISQWEVSTREDWYDSKDSALLVEAKTSETHS